MGPLLFVVYANDVWRNMQLTIGIFADDCVIYRKIMKKQRHRNLPIYLERWWVGVNGRECDESRVQLKSDGTR